MAAGGWPGKAMPMSLAAACLLALVAFDARACRTDPPRPSPNPGELAASSALVAVVHVDRVPPMSAEDRASLNRLLADPPLNVAIRLPANSAEVTAVRVLKGRMPVPSRVRSGITSCDVALTEGGDYLVFAAQPEADGEIAPLYGTFQLDSSQSSLDAMAEVEAALASLLPAQP